MAGIMHPRHRCTMPAPTRSRPAGLGPLPHRSLRPGDRVDPQFDSVVLVDGYQPCRFGASSVLAVTAYQRPDTGPIAEPPLDSSDYLLCQFAFARDRDSASALMWVCDLSYEAHPEAGHLLGGRVDDGVARTMRSAEFIVVLDVPTSSAWTMDNVCLKLPNNREMWAAIPELG
jgi:hypothetical protein